LLAFTLEQLYLDYGRARGELRLADYETFGGITGAIEAAVERALAAADADRRIPRDRETRLLLLRRGLIPWLAGIDLETGSPRRRIARRDDVPAEARPLIDLLVEQRLLATDRSAATGEVTIEPAHESLLRQWGLLKGWLDEDFPALTTLEGVKRAARDWAANAERADWLSHTGVRLAEAERFAGTELAGDLLPEAGEYLRRCRARDDTELRDKEEMLAGREAARVVQLVEAAADERSRGNYQSALKVAVHAARLDLKLSSGRGGPSVALAGLAAAFTNHRLVLRGHEGSLFSAAFSPDGTRIVTASSDKTARIWDAASGEEIAALRGHGGHVFSAAFSPDGTRIVTASSDKTARIWDAATGTEIAVMRGHDVSAVGSLFRKGQLFYDHWDRGEAKFGNVVTVRSAAFSPDGTRIVTGSEGFGSQIWDAITTKQLAVLLSIQPVRSAAFSPDGTRIVTTVSPPYWQNVISGAVSAFSSEPKLIGGRAEIWDAAWSGDISRENPLYVRRRFLIAVLQGHGGLVNSAAFSPDGTRIVTASFDKTAIIWDVPTKKKVGSWWWGPTEGNPIAMLRGHAGSVNSAAFSPDGARIVTASEDGTARIWDAVTWKEIAMLHEHGGPVNSAAFSPDGTRVVTATKDGTALISGIGLNVSTISMEELLAKSCLWLRGVSTMTRDEMRLAGYPDDMPEIDVCAASE
jgi:WD40 repeat protein